MLSAPHVLWDNDIPSKLSFWKCPCSSLPRESKLNQEAASDKLVPLPLLHAPLTEVILRTCIQQPMEADAENHSGALG